jgi:hypothetical protein
MVVLPKSMGEGAVRGLKVEYEMLQGMIINIFEDNPSICTKSSQKE